MDHVRGSCINCVETASFCLYVPFGTWQIADRKDTRPCNAVTELMSPLVVPSILHLWSLFLDVGQRLGVKKKKKQKKQKFENACWKKKKKERGPFRSNPFVHASRQIAALLASQQQSINYFPNRHPFPIAIIVTLGSDWIGCRSKSVCIADHFLYTRIRIWIVISQGRGDWSRRFGCWIL